MSTAIVNRRGFLYGGSAAAAAPLAMAGSARPLVLLVDGKDKLVRAKPVVLAIDALVKALTAAGYKVSRQTALTGHPSAAIIVKPAKGLAGEGFSIAAEGGVVTVSGSDARGLMYGVRELASRVAADPAAGLAIAAPVTASPLNPVRSVMRQFTSAMYDKAWFHDKAMWPAYLSMLANERFNRLHLCFGLAYDALSHVADSYFLFTYPYLVDVPGYDVKVRGLDAAERDKNLAMLQYISEQTVAHGLDFQLGLWMHGYQWPEAPGVDQIEGLNSDNHAAYCRDALALLLKKLPAASSVSLRFHGESGIKEGSYAFWKTVFSGVPKAGRRIEIDLHAKGVDETMIANALATGMPVNIAPKYWGEHLGMPYHQAAIREYDRPKPGQIGKGLLTLSEGARSFTRYGFADLLRDSRPYTIRHRVFPGTQHILASGDPDWAARYGKMFSFCGSQGADLMEPLTYRGRRGSAVSSAPRSGYGAKKLEAQWDWQKYGDWYRNFGRGLYDPASLTAPSSALKKALGIASHILPIVTTAYMPSAACDAYWPEVHWNQPLAGEPNPNPYSDMLAPKVFHNAGALDPQLFSSMKDFAAELMGIASGRISPLVVATWLEDAVNETQRLMKAAGAPGSVEEARLGIDIAVMAGLGAFFAAKFRAGVLYALFEMSRDKRALDAAQVQYRKARDAWAEIAASTSGVYSDVSSSDILTEHGAWADKLAGIDADIAAVEKSGADAKAGSDAKLAAAMAMAEGAVAPHTVSVAHTAPAALPSGSEIGLDFAVADSVQEAELWYRAVNQAAVWEMAAMTKTASGWHGVIPAAAAATPYPMQYYAVFRTAADKAALYPGFAGGPGDFPYIVLERKA